MLTILLWIKGQDQDHEWTGHHQHTRIRPHTLELIIPLRKQMWAKHDTLIEHKFERSVKDLSHTIM